MDTLVHFPPPLPERGCAPVRLVSVLSWLGRCLGERSDDVRRRGKVWRANIEADNFRAG